MSNPKTILVTGADGRLGSKFPNDICLKLGSDDLDVSRILDITKIAVYNKDIKYIINCAAYTNIDKCEEHPFTAFYTNTNGAANLAKVCASNNIKLIHISTNYVFGSNNNKLDEFNEMDIYPLNVYGMSKLHAEQQIEAIDSNALIIRTQNLWDDKLIDELYHKKELDAYNLIKPTNAQELANKILENKDDFGILHLVGKDEVSLFDFVVDKFKASDDEDHEPEICRAEYKVRRPLNCNLVSSRVSELKSYKEYV